VAVAGPPDTDLDRLYDGLRDAAAEFSCPIVGGDLATAAALVVTVTVLGDGKGSPPPVRRAGSRPGDRVFVTGPLGASAAGLRQLRADPQATGPPVEAHRRPIPLLGAGRAARQGGATAMIDVSDGFAADLGHVLDASRVGVRVFDVPVAGGATRDEAVAGGEDYQLVFTASDEAAVRAAFEAGGVDPPLVVGMCDADPSVRLLDGAPLPRRGWEHPWR
jgi:thiamine-monophosphate kinase